MKKFRYSLVIFGLLLPYLARIPGIPFKGIDWLTSMAGKGLGSMLFFAAFNTICWGPIYALAGTFKKPRYALFPAAFGFAFPLYAYVTIDLASSSTAAIALIFIPIYSVPLTLIGWMAGKYYEGKALKGIENKA
ncbi:MAG: hypothetical protein ACAH83_03135 [Alphaproteobacteria bacterium]